MEQTIKELTVEEQLTRMTKQRNALAKFIGHQFERKIKNG